MCNAIHRYATANNKYMRNHNKGKESYLIYWECKQSVHSEIILKITCGQM